MLTRRSFLKWLASISVVGVAPKTQGSVYFDGATDYLTRGPELTGLADGFVSQVYFWPKYLDLTIKSNRDRLL